MKRVLAFLCTVFICISSAFAADWEQLNPTTEFFVNDFANIIDSETEKQIIELGKQMEVDTTAQVVVVTVDNMDGNTIENFGFRLGDKWKVGEQGENNGVLLIVSMDERKSRIEVGDGLGGALTDALTGRIQDDYMTPYFAEGDFSTGFLEGYKAVAREVYQEYGVEPGENLVEEQSDDDVSLAAVVFIVVGIIAMGILFGGGGNNNGTRGGGRYYRTYGTGFDVYPGGFGGHPGGFGGSSGGFGGSSGGGGSFGGGGSSRGF